MRGGRRHDGRKRKTKESIRKDIEKGYYEEGDWVEVKYWCPSSRIMFPREGEGERTTPHEWSGWETTPQYDNRMKEKYGDWGAEYNHEATMREFVVWLKKNNLKPSDVKGFTPDGHVILKPITQRANYKPDVMFSAEEEEIWDDEDYYNIEGEDYFDKVEEMYEDFCEDWEDNPDNDGQECPSMDEWVDTYGNFDAEDMNWGGDPKGQLATAIRKARIKAKELKKPLKIEKLDADNSFDSWRWIKPKAIGHVGGGPKYNGYFAIKGYEGDTKDGFRYRILKDPYERKDWYRVYVYDIPGSFANKSKRLNPRIRDSSYGSYGENTASIMIGSFPTLEQAKRALVFRMIQDEQFHHRLTDAELHWLIYGTKPGSRKWKKAETSGQWEIGEQLEEAQMNAEDDTWWPSNKYEGTISVGMPCGYCDKQMSDEWWDDLENEEIEDAWWDVQEVKRGYYERKCYARCPHCKIELEIIDDEFNYGESLIAENYEAEATGDNSWKELLIWVEDYLWDNDKKGYQAYYNKLQSLGLNAEEKKRKKISGVLSDPFDEVSLDSGGIKKGIVALAAVGLTIFGIIKWK